MGTKPAKVGHLQSLGVNSAKVRRFCATKTSPFPPPRSSLRGRTKVAKVGHLRARVKSAKVRPTPFTSLGPPGEDHRVSTTPFKTVCLHHPPPPRGCPLINIKKHHYYFPNYGTRIACKNAGPSCTDSDTRSRVCTASDTACAPRESMLRGSNSVKRGRQRGGGACGDACGCTARNWKGAARGWEGGGEARGEARAAA